MDFSARDFLLDVAADMEIPPDKALLDLIVLQMRDEYVLTVDQLKSMEASEWASLGCPIGLASAVRLKLALLEFEGEQDEDEDDGDLDDERIDGIYGASPKKESSTWFVMTKTMLSVTALKDWVFPVDHQLAFKKSAMHALSPYELKAQTMVRKPVASWY